MEYPVIDINHKYTNQEVFDIVAAWLTRPDATPSVSQKHGCAYRTEDGNRCAIGVLITDEQYNLSMESDGAKYLLKKFDLLHLGCVDENLIGWLQNCHDGDRLSRVNTETWRNEVRIQLKSIANMYGLKWNTKYESTN